MGSNITSSWDSGKWGGARWARYQAIWDNGVWVESFWNFIWQDIFRNMLANLETKNVGWTMFKGVFKPGLMEHNTVLQKALEGLEKK